MTVGKRDGAAVPVWAAVTVIVSILLAVGGITVGAVSRASEADHRALQVDISATKAWEVAGDIRLREVETGVATLKAQYIILIDGQARILQAIDDLRTRQ